MTRSSLLSLPSTDIDVGGLLGSQTPRVRRAPAYDKTLGHEAVDFMAQVGKPLDEWQAEIVVDAFGLRPDGYWSAFEVVCLLSRQNGKGGVTEAIELPGLFLFGDQIIMHSAHLFKTAKQSFQRLVDIIDGSDWLTRRVKRIMRARGDEEIELTSKAGGGRLLCFSRTGGAGRGFTGDKTVFDEAAYLTIEQYAAATPTLATVPNPQIIYTGTPPDEDVGPMPDDAMLPSVRKRGHAGGDRIALYEWSPEEGYDRTDPKVWAACNPALGVRIMPWFLAKQLENFTAAGKPAKFDTEHLGVWPPEVGSQWSVISEKQWLDAEDPNSVPVDPIVFAISMNYDRTFTCIALAGARADGDLHVEVPPADHKPGTGWVVARAKELNERWKPARWVVAGPAASLIPDLEAAGLSVTKMTPGESATGFGMLYDGLTRKPGELAADQVEGEDPRPVRRVRVRPLPALSTAMAGAKSRHSGDVGRTWESRDVDVDMSPVRAITDALWGFMTRPVEPETPFFASWR